MEFRYGNSYRKVMLGWILPLLTMVIFTILYYLDYLFYNGIIIVFVPGLFINFSSFLVYYSNRDTIIRLDEDKISKIQPDNVLEIYWDSVTEVTWDKSAMSIDSKERNLVIGIKIDGIEEIVPFVKQKVGDRFETYMIPWEIKRRKD